MKLPALHCENSYGSWTAFHNKSIYVGWTFPGFNEAQQIDVSTDDS